MEPKNKLFYLFFALLSASLCRDVAGRLVTGTSPMPDSVIEYSEDNQQDAEVEITDYNMASFLSAMEKFAENVDKKLDSVISHEIDLKQYMKKTIEHSLLEETKNIALLLTDQMDTLVKEKNIETMNIIKVELNEMKNDMRNILATSIQLEILMRKEIKELADKITLFTTIIQHPKEKTIVSEADVVLPAGTVEMTTEDQTMINDIYNEQSDKQSVRSIPIFIEESEYTTEFTPAFIQHLKEETKKVNGEKDYVLPAGTVEKTTEDQTMINGVYNEQSDKQSVRSIPIFIGESVYTTEFTPAFIQHIKEETTKVNGEKDDVLSAEWVEIGTEKQIALNSTDSVQNNKQTVSSTTDNIEESKYSPSEATPSFIQKFQEETDWNDEEEYSDDIFQESVETTTKKQYVLKDMINKWERDHQAPSITVSDLKGPNYISNQTSLCDLVVPSSIITEQDVWIVERKPIFDDLDTFAILHTGCTYTGLNNRENFYTPPLMYDGSLFEWRGALRAPENGDFVVQWGSHAGYAFYIGQDGNAVTRFIQRSPWTDLVVLSTPGILSINRYVPFYIRIREGVLTFGQECESEPMFTYNVTIQAGESVYVSFYPFSKYGGKHLFHCPPPISGAV